MNPCSPFDRWIVSAGLFVALAFQTVRGADQGGLIFACRADNDLYCAVAAGLGQPPPRFATPGVAVAQAPPGAAVLLLADIRSSAIERARALLPLAWLIRIEDTPEHRGWLRRVAEDLLATQDASGALRETIEDGRQGTASNAEYGTRETTLIQTNGDPVCDLLYTCNFALIGLHEAAAATGEPRYREAEDRLARFLCRVQIRSEFHPELDGAWYRAFDFRRWEYWASNADWEWGPWCIESGWTQPWIAGTLALRQRQTSLWDLIRRSHMHEHFTRLIPQMLSDGALLPQD